MNDEKQDGIIVEEYARFTDELRDEITSRKSIETLKEWVRIAASSNTISEFADHANGKDR